MAMIAKILVIVGGVNWGLIGLGMLLGTVGGLECSQYDFWLCAST